MSSQQQQHAKPPGPPYLPQVAMLGGVPSTLPDVPISAVLLALFAAAAALNMTIFQRNRRRGHKFVPSGVTFGFCMARITANAMRVAWSQHPSDARVALAAGVFTNAGVLLLFVINLIFFQRVLRAHHPRFGWSKGVSWAFKFLYFGVFSCLAMVVVAVVYSYHTLDRGVQAQLRDVRLVASVYLAVLAFIPLPGTILTVLIPGSGPVDNFGKGSMRTKVLLLVFTSTLLSLGASFRTGTSFFTRPLDNPGWFNHKAAFYCFNFVIELIVVYTYALMRMDRRFWIPDGAKGPGSYTRGTVEKSGESQDEEAGERTLVPEDENAKQRQ